MDGNGFFSWDKARSYVLEKDGLISINGRRIRIGCVSGEIWITWPDGNERTLREGQGITVASRGKVCVVALSRAGVRIQRKGFNPFNVFNRSGVTKHAGVPAV